MTAPVSPNPLTTLDDRPAISLQELDAGIAARQVRVDRKYILPPAGSGRRLAGLPQTRASAVDRYGSSPTVHYLDTPT